MPAIQGPLDLSYQESDKFLLALGRLVAESALLESQLDWGIWFLLDTREQRTGQIVTADLDFRRKVNLVLALTRHHLQNEQMRDEVVNLVKPFHALYDERNDFIHGMWAASANNMQRGLVRASAKGELRIVFKDVDVARIDSLAQRFHDAAAAFSEITIRILL